MNRATGGERRRCTSEHIFICIGFIPKRIEDARLRQASEAPVHRSTL